ncbi:hypothetical protein [Streptomyces sp. NPDC059009]|uniref:hypothetical protein n=1 Tax=Streptomyces sp. NPDC059009 TaxID=3346694 RepID=UPI0036749924
MADAEHLTPHWSVTPVAYATGPVLEFRAAQLERYGAEADFLATQRGTLEAWSAGLYMESAWLAESWAYHAAKAVSES